MPRHLRITLLVLVAWGLLVVFFLPGMGTRVSRISRFGDAESEKQAQREVTRPAVGSDTAPLAKARLYFASSTGDAVEPVDTQLPLAPAPETRARQLLDALITRPPSEAHRTLPAEAVVLETYLLQDGTAVIDFSSAIGASLPSGILSERLALESINKTLAANIDSIWRVKILIQGQEADTLAGHADLTGYFVLRNPPAEKSEAEKAATGRGVRASR